MMASRKKASQGLQLDEIFLDNAQDRAGFWSDESVTTAPVTARKDVGGFAASRSRPANDDGRPRQVRAARRGFVGSRQFVLGFAAMLALGVLFTLIAGVASGAGAAALLANPARYAAFWASLAVICAIPWAFALSAHRSAVGNDMLRRVLLVTQRMYEPSAVADNAGRRINASFDQMFADIDARMALLDAKSLDLAEQVAAAMYRSAESADANIANMRSIVEASEVQREALQRSGMMISTEILPVIARLESTIMSLETVSQNAGGVLETIASRLQHSTRELTTCLELFNGANHNVAPELDRRMQKFEASIARLPEQLDATIGRLSPLSDTIADAAMLSTANIEVIDQLANDITIALERSRSVLNTMSSATASVFRDAVETHVAEFRDTIGAVVAEEADRVSSLSVALDQLAGTAVAAVDKLNQPVSLMTASSDQILANVKLSLDSLDQRIGESLRSSVAELGDAAARILATVNREIEASTMSLQTRLAASSTDLMQRVNTDTARFEALIGETAERTSGRVAAALRDLPAVLSQSVEAEIAKVDGSLKGTILALSDQLRHVADDVPDRLATLTRETLHALEMGISRSFDEVSERSQGLNETFHQAAVRTTESVLQNYVDFIYLAIDRFRAEMDSINQGSGPVMETAPKAEVLEAAPIAELDGGTDAPDPAPER